MGDSWVHLRMCLECGNVACCDSSKNKHATKHFHSSKHPLMRSIEPGERWIWCYVDEIAAGELEELMAVSARSGGPRKRGWIHAGNYGRIPSALLGRTEGAWAAEMPGRRPMSCWPRRWALALP